MIKDAFAVLSLSPEVVPFAKSGGTADKESPIFYGDVTEVMGNLNS